MSYFSLAGIVSQVSDPPVDGSIGIAIAPFFCEAVDLEIESVIYALFVGEIEQCDVRTNSTPQKAAQVISIAKVEKELTFTKEFLELTSLWATKNWLRNNLEVAELITIESGWTEVLPNVTSAIEIELVEPIQRELQSVPIAYDLSPITLKTEFLPGSPGYVAGIPALAVELIGVEPGLVPLPLPAGQPFAAKELLRIEAALTEIQGTRNTSEFSITEAAHNLLDNRTLPANTISIIEVADAEPQVTAIATAISELEPVEAKISSNITAPQLITIESGWTEVRPNVTSAIEIKLIEPIQKELQLLLPITHYPLPQEAVSLITKP